MAGPVEHSAPEGENGPPGSGGMSAPLSLILQAMPLRPMLFPPALLNIYLQRGVDGSGGKEVLNLDCCAYPSPPNPSPHMAYSESPKRQIGSCCFLLTPHCFPSCLRTRHELAPLASSLTPFLVHSQPHWPSLNRPLTGQPQGLCTNCSLHLGFPSPCLCPFLSDFRLDAPPQRSSLTTGSKVTDYHFL